LLSGGYFSVDGDDPSGEVVCSFIGEESHCLDALFVKGADGQCCHYFSPSIRKSVAVH
jgi:hypothetical protein